MSESRRLVADSIGRILSEAVTRATLDDFERGAWPAALWSLVEDSGFGRVLAAEDAPAADWNDAEPVLHALGYHCAPLPLAETLLANWLCARAGLPIADGPQTVLGGEGLALARGADGRWRLAGRARRVPWARAAKRFVVAADADGRTAIATCDAAQAGIAIEPGSNVAAEPRDTVTFAGCPVAALGFDERLPRDAVTLYGALARATMMAGAACAALDQSVRYVNDRRQFGRPLARFQAVQHMLAELGEECAAATMAATAACAAAGGAGARLDIAVAKVRAGTMATRVPRIAHQVHGAMGFTHEYGLHFATRRLWSWRREFGSDAAWAAEIGAAAIAAGGASFWPRLMVDGVMPAP